jgi:hypothetical protein
MESFHSGLSAVLPSGGKRITCEEEWGSKLQQATREQSTGRDFNVTRSRKKLWEETADKTDTDRDGNVGRCAAS